ncbi:MAG: SDR family NAD(P)-dependent oxidoreductase, partial [Chloroflexota bacterium]|nr:SDR family NAD(P)-dependent oxidoreductase [Chloroflexota bacterium]
MDLLLRDKVAVIAGGSRGIGRAVALVLAEEGCRLVLAARGEEGLRRAQELVEARGAEASIFAGDLTRPDDCQRLVQTALDAFGRIDILVNSLHASLPGQDEETWRRGLEALLLTPVRLTSLVAPVMRQQGGGVIVHMASIWGRESGGTPAYNAAKAALISHAKAMATALAPDGIRVVAVAPGSIA